MRTSAVLLTRPSPGATRAQVTLISNASGSYTFRKYGARGVDLANLVFERPASRGTAFLDVINEDMSDTQ